MTRIVEQSGHEFSMTLTNVIRVSGPGEAARQAQVLRGEGVEVSTGALGELLVDFSTYGWFPESLDDA